jgi:hypothetical protein
MTFRFARHTNNLEQLKSFYIYILGLELLGGFENHNGYDGVFIGKQEENGKEKMKKLNHSSLNYKMKLINRMYLVKLLLF